MNANWILPDWPAPASVKTLVTTRAGGVSIPPYASLNLGDHVGDDPASVMQNRTILRAALPAEPVWLRQVHGVTVLDADSDITANIAANQADASLTRRANRVCAILSADCLPVLLCDQDASVVAAAHAGWRGLAAGVLEATVGAMRVPGERIIALLGPAIGVQMFEVGNEVRDAFVNVQAQAETAFIAGLQRDKWRADIYALARLRLARAGVHRIYGGGACTYSDPERFYSYRRDGATGRMASLIWLEG